MKPFCFIFLFFSLLNATLVKVPNTELYHGAADVRNHPGYYPFISHLTFRHICNHIIDQTTEWFDPDVVKQGDTVYMNMWYLEWFVKNIHAKIKYPYILVSGDVGSWAPGTAHKKFLYDPKLAAWFCRNTVFSYHPKLIQLPMGQDLALFGADAAQVKDLLYAASLPFTKKHLLYMCFLPRAYGDRNKIINMFIDEPYCYTKNNGSGTAEWGGTSSKAAFYEDLAASCFTLSPLGLETDCVRTWEALIVDCIPIVEHTFLDPLFDDLAVAFVHDWEEINKPFLEKKYQEITQKGYKRDKAYFDYWQNLIQETQNKVKNNDLHFSKLEATLLSDHDLEILNTILQENCLEKKHKLFMKGALTSLHSLQLTSALTSVSQIYLYDPWIDTDTFNNFETHLTDKALLKNKRKVIVLSSQNAFDSMLPSLKPTAVFVDLSYFRSSLDINFDNFRHSLKKDLIHLYERLEPSALIVGNKGDVEYVQEVLEKLSEECRVEVRKKDSFWFLKK